MKNRKIRMQKMRDFKKNRNRKTNSKNRNKVRNRGKGLSVESFINKVGSSKDQKKFVSKKSFSNLIPGSQILDKLQNKGYHTPTEIQEKSIPWISEGRDLVGIAGTGTGKTLAFLLPLVEKLHKNPENQSILVVTPTRELATQVAQEFKMITKGSGLYFCILIGGVPVRMSIKDLSRTNHIVIGTPGRIIDMAQRGELRLNKFKTLVLDEFDRMLDMGFIDEVSQINERLVAKEQTLLFSATTGVSIKKLIPKFTNDPVRVTAGIGTHNTNAIDQSVLRTRRGKEKEGALKKLLLDEVNEKVLLFCETKRLVDSVHSILRKESIRSEIIHGDKPQRARDQALRKFKSGKTSVLVATDVVARGIDVKDVSLVINYDAPRTYDDYIHRIGRTGRAGKSGRAITFIEQ